MKTKYKFLTLGFGLLLLFQGLFGLPLSHLVQTVSATSETYSYDGQNIIGKGEPYKGDATFKYSSNNQYRAHAQVNYQGGAVISCDLFMEPNGGNNNSSYNLYDNDGGDSQQRCADSLGLHKQDNGTYGKDVAVFGAPDSGTARNRTFSWLDSAHIIRADGRTYTKNSQGWFVWTGDKGECKEMVTVSSPSQGVFHHNGGSGNLNTSSCRPQDHDSNDPITINRTDRANDAPGKNGAGPNDGGSDADNPTCETTKGSQLSWIICPIVNGISDGLDYLFAKIIEPFLQNIPISTNTDSGTYQIWSGFRIFGNVVLIGGILALIFAQAFGGSVLDAYAVRKIAPRLLVAAIAVNLSIYLSVAVSEAFKVIGLGIGQIITAPLKNTGNFNFTPGKASFSWSGLISALAVIGVAATAATVWRNLATGIFNSSETGGFGGELLHVLLFGVFITLLLTVIGIFATLIIRQGLVIFLAVISPVAIALYVIPGTERYARQWWNLFSRALFVYPVITAIFAIADVLGTLIMQNNKNITGILTGITVLFLPMFLIPFAFKFAGGALATVYGAASNGMNRIQNSGFIKTRREENKRRLGYKVGQNRERVGANLGEQINAAEAEGKRARFARFRKGLVAGTGFEIAQAKRTAQEKEIKNLIKDNADDASLRAQTVDKAWADANGFGVDMTDSRENADGETEYHASDGSWLTQDQLNKRDLDWRTDDILDENGDKTGKKQRKYQTAGGAWVTGADIAQADRTFGRGNRLAYQAALDYEMAKAQTPGQKRRIYEQFRRDKERFGWTDGEAQGVWIAAAFGNQDHDISFKNSDWKTGGLITPEGTAGPHAAPVTDVSALRDQQSRQTSATKAAREAMYKKSDYQLGIMDSNFWDEQTAAHQEARHIVDTDSVTRAAIMTNVYDPDAVKNQDMRDAALKQHQNTVDEANKTIAMQEKLADRISAANQYEYSASYGSGGGVGGTGDPAADLAMRERAAAAAGVDLSGVTGAGDREARITRRSPSELRQTEEHGVPIRGARNYGGPAETQRSMDKFHDVVFPVEPPPASPPSGDGTVTGGGGSSPGPATTIPATEIRARGVPVPSIELGPTGSTGGPYTGTTVSSGPGPRPSGPARGEPLALPAVDTTSQPAVESLNQDLNTSIAADETAVVEPTPAVAEAAEAAEDQGVLNVQRPTSTLQPSAVINETVISEVPEQPSPSAPTVQGSTVLVQGAPKAPSTPQQTPPQTTRPPITNLPGGGPAELTTTTPSTDTGGVYNGTGGVVSEGPPRELPDIPDVDDDGNPINPDNAL